MKLVKTNALQCEIHKKYEIEDFNNYDYTVTHHKKSSIYCGYLKYDGSLTISDRIIIEIIFFDIKLDEHKTAKFEAVIEDYNPESNKYSFTVIGEIELTNG